MDFSVCLVKVGKEMLCDVVLFVEEVWVIWCVFDSFLGLFVSVFRLLIFMG